MSWFQSTHTANPELRSSLSHANNPAGTFTSVLVWELVVRNPAWMAESVANADGPRRYDATISIGTLPCVGCEASHYVGSAAGLPARGRRHAGAVMAGS